MRVWQYTSGSYSDYRLIGILRFEMQVVALARNSEMQFQAVFLHERINCFENSFAHAPYIWLWKINVNITHVDFREM